MVKCRRLLFIMFVVGFISCYFSLILLRFRCTHVFVIWIFRVGKRVYGEWKKAIHTAAHMYTHCSTHARVC